VETQSVQQFLSFLSKMSSSLPTLDLNAFVRAVLNSNNITKESKKEIIKRIGDGKEDILGILKFHHTHNNEPQEYCERMCIQDLHDYVLSGSTVCLSAYYNNETKLLSFRTGTFGTVTHAEFKETVTNMLTELMTKGYLKVIPEFCCLCTEFIRGYGNNAEPVRVGRCCDKCNATKVIPARMAQYDEPCDEPCDIN